jgi:uncharacterized protein YegL
MIDDQVPFDAELISNPEPRCPCVLLLDTSGSMRGRPLEELNQGVQTFMSEILADKLATLRVEVAMITFGPVNKVSDFQTLDHFNPPHLQPTGDTPMGAAIVAGLDLLEERKQHYKAAGISYYRPWLFLVTDGAPTDNYREAARRVQAGDNDERKAFSFWGIGVEGADMARLGEICSPNRPPLKLGGLNFRELFVWLSASMKSVAQSRPGESVNLPQPKWLTV